MAKAKHIKCERCGTGIVQSAGAGRTRYKCEACSPNYGAKTANYRCLRCGVDIDQPTGRGRLRKYCRYCRELRVRMSGVTYLVCMCGNRRSIGAVECKKCQHTKPCVRCGNPCLNNRNKHPTCSIQCAEYIKAMLLTRARSSTALSCAFCGSVYIKLKSQVRNTGGEYNYCDAECCGEHKKWLYMQPSHQDKIGKTERDRVAKQKARERKKLHAGWSCCIGCGVARKDRRSRMCEACTQDVERIRKAKYNKDLYNAECSLKYASCTRCARRFTYTEHRAKSRERKFCSKTCSARQHKSDRRHRTRANGPSDAISLIKLARKHKWKCAGCGTKCHKPDGSYRMDEATIDHVLPVSKGGTHTWDNVQLMCRQCNCAVKGDRVEPGTQMRLELAWQA